MIIGLDLWALCSPALIHSRSFVAWKSYQIGRWEYDMDIPANNDGRVIRAKANLVRYANSPEAEAWRKYLGAAWQRPTKDVGILVFQRTIHVYPGSTPVAYLDEKARTKGWTEPGDYWPVQDRT